MPRSIRVTALLLSVLMLISLMGCGQKKPDTTQPATAPSTETTQPAPETTALPDDTEPDTAPVTKAPEPTETEPTVTEEPNEPEPFELSLFQPIIEDGHYRYNPYLLSQEAIRYYDPGFLAFYRDFVTALMNYETECPCPNVDYAMDIGMVANYECPFYSVEDLEFSWATDYDYVEQKLTWTYRVDRDTLQERIRLVAEAMQSFLDLVTTADAEEDKVQTLYHAFCPLMTYDFDRRDSREHIDGFYALLEHTGICYSFAYAFSQILAQVDMDATIANGPIDDEPHVWNYVRVNGQYYFFDPTFELNFKNGTAYVYYGMNLEERLASGVEVETMGLGRYERYELTTAENNLSVH